MNLKLTWFDFPVISLIMVDSFNVTKEGPSTESNWEEMNRHSSMPEALLITHMRSYEALR